MENESGVINYIFKCKLDDGQKFSENVDQYTYFEFKKGDNVEVTTKKEYLKIQVKLFLHLPTLTIKKPKSRKRK